MLAASWEIEGFHISCKVSDSQLEKPVGAGRVLEQGLLRVR